MRIKSQDDILNPEVRKKIIDEIEGTENKARKHEAFKRYQIYKDETDYFVIQMLLRQFSPETVKEMSYAIANLSLARKAIDKLARVYSPGVDRTIDDGDESKLKLMEEKPEEKEPTKEVEAAPEENLDTEKLNKLEKLLEFNTTMKTLNRYLKLQRNCSLYIKPCAEIDDEGNEKYKITLNPLSPYLYDVVEDYHDRKKPMVYILSNYDMDASYYTSLDAGSAAVRFGGSASPAKLSSGDGEDQIIADKKEDEGKDESKKTYVWWTGKYHFTTRGSEIIDTSTGEEIDVVSANDERIKNPIQKLPFVNFAIDQDNSFWAKGGKDLTNGAITVNSLITNYHHIGVYTGFGQMVMTGKKLPKQVPIGPTTIIQLEYEGGPDDPQPTFDFKNSGAPLMELMKMVEMYVAMLLTTNNLSTKGVSTQLSGSAGDAASGIALMIDKAESMEDVHDQQQIFIDNEPHIWKLVNEWLMLHSAEGNLCEKLDGLSLPQDFKLNLQFREQPSIMSEKEKLDNLKLRKELGLNTMLDLIKIDQPGLDDAQAKEKLAKIEEEKSARMLKAQESGLNPDGTPIATADDSGDNKAPPKNLGAKNGFGPKDT
jgi:hypothetical protein